jgi:adenylate cyclase
MARPNLRLSTRQQGWLTRIALALGVALVIIVFTQESILRLGILQRLELASVDYRFQYRGVNQGMRDSSHVVIVEINEEAFKSLHEQFPWPRSFYAHLLRNLKAAGARAVGIDLLFSTPDIHDPRHDDSLRVALAATGIGVLSGKREADNDSYITTSSDETFGNIFFRDDQSMGLVNVRTDADGVFRSYNTLYAVDSAGGGERRIPTLAFAVLNKYFGLPPMTVPEVHDGFFTYAGRVIPQVDRASMMVNYYGPDGTFPHIRFHDVLDDETLQTNEEAESGEDINTFSDPSFGYLHDGTFKDKVVLVGVTVPEYKDLFPVAIARGERKRENMMYGVEIHANAVESVIRGDFLRPESPAASALTTFVLVFITFMVTSQMREIKTRHHLVIGLLGFFFALSMILLTGALSLVLFTKANYIMGVVNSVLAIIGGYSMSTTYHMVTERKERMLIKSMFSTYVNPSLVDELVAHPEKLVLGGQREELTVLFSDIVGFTAISEYLSPEELVSILNEYLEVMSGIIFRNDGTLDKYEGDAVMAFWGAPIPQKDHAIRACRAALEMQQALVALNETWKQAGRPPIRIRIGVNTGDMVVGNMGAVGKFAYTVIGDSVNLASRLEGANREYGTGVMVSQRTYDLACEEVLGRELDRIAVMGRSEPVTTFELMAERSADIPKEMLSLISAYEEGKRLYHAREWTRAEEAFRRALTFRPDDHPSLLHLQRIEVFKQTPPPEDWDGVFVFTKK